MKPFSVLTIASAIMLAAFTAPAESQPGARAEHMLGPLHIGMAYEEVKALGLPSHRIVRTINEHQVITEHVAIGQGQVIDVLIQDNHVTDLSTSSRDYVVPGGGHVGLTLADLRSLYPHGRFYWGSNNEFGPFMNYDTGAGGLSFAFNTDNLRPECMEAHRRCPSDFEAKRVMMVVVR
jgi:hypothetical protein